MTSFSAAFYSTFIAHSASRDISSKELRWDYVKAIEKADCNEGGFLGLDVGAVGSKMIRHMGSSLLEVNELEDLPWKWRRSKLMWLCKELPALDEFDVITILNAGRKWLRQEDVTYVIVHSIHVDTQKCANTKVKVTSALGGGLVQGVLRKTDIGPIHLDCPSDVGLPLFDNQVSSGLVSWALSYVVCGNPKCLAQSLS
ncbi:hypothetical protein Dsin_026992 [Dipteronia sinensis]|uniref:Uncharacterized protein n=1 Tax=Dipteronia sinensis TaxID=43782 RepID=A0AAD9ZYT8_9ROSI|nr:hypothetical protein Dsin_026992 [Dipteronia sinensis]